MKPVVVKIVNVRSLLFAILFVVVVMAIYFALIPDDYYHNRIVDEEHLVNNIRSSSWLVAAKAMAKNGGVVYTTMVNDAYFDFAASWLCNTRKFDVHSHVLFLSTDRITGQRLRSVSPQVTVVSLYDLQFAGSQEYSKAGYVRMMVERTHFILQLLEAHLTVFLFEVDCLWLSNPLPVMLSQEYSQADIIATRVSGQNVIAGGFLLLRSTEATISLWRRLTEMMEDLHKKISKADQSAAVSEALNDQQFITILIKNKYANIKVMFLPEKQFPDGKWYEKSEAEQHATPLPIIINNNWVLGNELKTARAKKYGHWFWDSLNKNCNNTALHALFG